MTRSRTLGGVLTLLAAWCALAVPVAVVLGRAIRHADQHRPGRVPQLDVPLWRGTDLDRPTVGEDLAGAILGLAYATDETSARYWLSICARRGADWQTQRELWDTWQAMNDSTVHRIHTDRNEDQ